MIQLLDPPFDKSDLNPGYIKGYVPGVRENGGQYTHAAVWAAMAFARLGDSRRAWELFEMINPVNHSRSAEETGSYKVEPYVVAADVYAAPPHTGRGGWTWYTGSAAWMYRLIVESLLGLRLEVDKLRFAACLPADWDGFKMHYRYRETVYHIAVKQTRTGYDEMHVTVDGVEQHDKSVPLVDDQWEHSVEVSINAADSTLQVCRVTATKRLPWRFMRNCVLILCWFTVHQPCKSQYSSIVRRHPASDDFCLDRAFLTRFNGT